MSAAQHQCGGGFVKRGNQLGKRQSRFHIPAHGIEDHQYPAHLPGFLGGHQLRNEMLIAGGLFTLAQEVMPLYLSDDRETFDFFPALPHQHAAVVKMRSVRGLFFFRFLHFPSPFRVLA